MPASAPILTGFSLVSALGSDCGAVWSALLENRSGLAPLTRFVSSRCGHFPVAQAELPDDAQRFPSRAQTMAVAAARMAMRSAQLHNAPPHVRNRIGLVLGATVGGMPESELFAQQLCLEKSFVPDCFRFHEPAVAADSCARVLGLGGPCLTVSTACSSGALALLQAALWLENGEADCVIAGGVDVLCRLTLNGFASLLLVDPNGCRPFDAKRAGISLGEGAAFLVLERYNTAQARGAPMRAMLSGWGATCDAYHVTAPDPAGRGAAAAINAAIAQAGLEPGNIDYINAHGTGTRDNDAAEATSLQSVFGDAIPPVSSTKRAFGHTLAASGAIEAVVCALAIEHKLMPPNPGFQNYDERIGFSPITNPMPAALTHALSTSFGFGGNNVCLVLSAIPKKAASHSRPNVTADANQAIAVAALNFLTPAGNTFEDLAKRLATNKTVCCTLPPHLPCDAAPVLACDDTLLENSLDPMRHRRLTRMLRWAVACGLRCRAQLPPALTDIQPARTGVTIGTGLGSMEDTDRFITNMICQHEQSPMPASFIHSVHNAMPARLAMELKACGINATTIHREISFEAALWLAVNELRNNRLDLAYSGAADEINPYILAAGRYWNWWPNPEKKQFDVHRRSLAPEFQQPPCGEGMLLAALTRAGRVTTPIAHIEAVAIASRFTASTRFDAPGEVAWLQNILIANAIDPKNVDLLMSGAGGWRDFDPMYDALTHAWSSTVSKNCATGSYKHLCGEFNAASAIGMVVAIGMIAGRLPVAPFLDQPAPAPHKRPQRILIYTLARSGTKAMMVIRA